MIVLQAGGPSLGDLLNLVGIGILLVAAYHYIQYDEATDEHEVRQARRNLSVVLLSFVFYSVVAYMYWGHTESWVVLIGDSVNLYFEQVAGNLVLAEETSPAEPTLLDDVLDGLRTIGLVAYVLLFGATAVVGKAPLLIYQAIFD